MHSISNKYDRSKYNFPRLIQIVMKNESKNDSSNITNAVVNSYKKFILWLPTKFLIVLSQIIRLNFLDIILTIVDKNCYCHFHLLAIKYDEKSICLRFIAKFLIIDKYIFHSSLCVFYNDDNSNDNF